MMPEPDDFTVRPTVPPAVPPNVTGTVQVVPLPVGVPTTPVAPPTKLVLNEAAVIPVTGSLKVRLKLTAVLVFVPTVNVATVGGVVSVGTTVKSNTCTRLLT